MSSFQLPDPAGRAGGACTSTLLNILYENKEKPMEELSFKDVLLRMRLILRQKGFDQIPQLSSSHSLDVDTPFDLSPEDFSGTKRAVMIGINYVGQAGELAGCHNDVLNMKEYLMDVHEFEEENITVLMDDGVHPDPTRSNIIYAYQRIVQESEPGDVVYLHYSGKIFFAFVGDCFGHDNASPTNISIIILNLKGMEVNSEMMDMMRKTDMMKH